MNRGIFITFEGLDGSGKSTQLRLLAGSLQAAGRSVVTLRQPGGTPFGDRIRALLLDSRHEGTLGALAPEAELALMFADRAQSIAQVILPSLAAGSVVLSDRYTDSSEAYQGAGRQLGPDCVHQLHHALCGNVQPDLTVLVVPSMQVSLRRAGGRNVRHLATFGTDENRFEREEDAFFTRVHAQYEEIARREPHRVLAIRDNASIESIAALILAEVQRRLAQAEAPPAT